MIRLVHLTDTHVQGQTPKLRTDNLPKTLLAKLGEVGEIVREYGVDAVLHTGDIIEQPDIGNGIMGDLVRVLRGWNVPIYGIPGNHDVWGQNPKSIRSTVLNVAWSADVIDILSAGDRRVIEKDGIKIQLTGQPFHYQIDRRDPRLDYFVTKTDCDYAIHMVHSMLVDEPFPWGPQTRIEDVTTEADLILSGHYHPGFKEVYNLNGTLFCNPGSFARTKVSDVERHPQVALIEVDQNGIRINMMPIKCAQPGEAVFDLDEVARTKEREIRVAGWTEQINDIDDYRVIEPVHILDRISGELRVESEVAERSKERVSSTAEKLEVDLASFESGRSDQVWITSIELFNFQGYEHALFELTPGLNILCGPSDVGKSSVIRALGWVIENRWSDIYMHVGATQTRVKISLSTGYSVERIRNQSGSVNRYVVTYPDGQSMQYDKFGTKVPPEVSQVLGMAPWRLDDDIEINPKFRRQEDQNFLIYEPGSLKAKAIGYTMGVHLFDAAIRDADLDIARMQREEKQLEIELKELQEERKEYETVQDDQKTIEDLLATLERIRLLEEEIQKAEAIVGTIAKYRQHLSIYESALERFNRAAEMEPDVRNLADELAKVQAADLTLTTLKNARRQAEHDARSLEIMGRVADHEDAVHVILSEVNQVVAAEQTYTQIKTQRRNLEFFTRAVDRISPAAEAIDSVRTLRSEIDAVLRADHLITVLDQQHEALDQINRKLDVVRSVSELDPAVQRLHKEATDVAGAQALVQTIKSGRVRLAQYDHAIEGLRAATDQEELARHSHSIAATIEQASRQMHVLSALRSEKDTIEKKVAVMLDVESLRPDVERLQAELANLSAARGIVDLLQSLRSDYDETTKGMEEARRKQDELLAQLDVCPTCQRPMDLDHALQHAHGAKTNKTRSSSNGSRKEKRADSDVIQPSLL